MKGINSENKEILSTALAYLKAALKDLEWEASLQGWAPEEFNHHTNGTPSFDSSEELKDYLYEMKEFIDQFDDFVNDTKSYRVTVPYQEMVTGRLNYYLQARSKDEAIELASESVCAPDESIVDYGIGQYHEFWDDTEVEEL